MKPILKWSLAGLGVAAIGVGAGLTYMAGSPKDAFGLVRYALPHMHVGDLKVGSTAPDATLVGLDGDTRFHLRDHVGGKPLVLVFGSFT